MRIQILQDPRKYKFDKVRDFYICDFCNEEVRYVFPYYKLNDNYLLINDFVIDENAIFKEPISKFSDWNHNEEIKKTELFEIDKNDSKYYIKFIRRYCLRGTKPFEYKLW